MKDVRERRITLDMTIIVDDAEYTRLVGVLSRLANEYGNLEGFEISTDDN